MAERFDEDPFLIFKLRGRAKEEIIEALRGKRAAAAPPEDATSAAEAEEASQPSAVPLEACLDTFWQAGETLSAFTVRLQPPDVEQTILKRLGVAPFEVDGKNVSGLLEEAYRTAGRAALRRAFGEDGEEEG